MSLRTTLKDDFMNGSLIQQFSGFESLMLGRTRFEFFSSFWHRFLSHFATELKVVYPIVHVFRLLSGISHEDLSYFGFQVSNGITKFVEKVAQGHEPDSG